LRTKDVGAPESYASSLLWSPFTPVALLDSMIAPTTAVLPETATE